MRLPLEPGDVRRALFIRLRRFGDTIVLGHAIRAFRRWAPGARLGVVVQPGYEAYVELLPEVDAVVIAGRGVRDGAQALARVCAFGADLAIDFHGNPRAALLTLASGARLKVGERRFRWPVYDVRTPHAELVFGLERRSHTVENHLALLAAIGIPTPPEPLALPVPAQARAALAHRLGTAGVPDGPRVVLFPTTTLRGKQWPIERWFSLAARLAETWTGAILLPFAPGEDSMAEHAREAAGGAHVLPSLPLAELSALASTAALVVAQDSLGAHLAAAHGVPSVLLFGATDPAEYHPWMAEHVVLRVEGLCCSPCGGRSCRSPYYPWACIDGLDEDAVLGTVLAWLAGERPGARTATPRAGA
ncbi:MAG TPA: glycosyltransferase family 9 protein [Gemmatimonadota bacterium]|nr:glycosyltransferase family 9 protein [Gemmatimonadota bacterium]